MKILQGLLIIFLPIMVILCNLLVLVYSINFYESIYKKENIYQNFQSVQVANNTTKDVIGYFRGQNNLEDIFFSTQAKVHLKDVKFLLQTAITINFFSILAVITSTIFLLIHKSPKHVKRSIIIGSFVTLAIVIIIAVSLALNFNFLFIKFHELLFRNNFWLFPESDNLIKLFPQEFFIDFAKQLGINIILSSILVMFIGFIIPKQNES